MLRTLLILVVGVAIGYFYGFHDAQVHRHDIVARAVQATGGSVRGDVGNNVDGMMDSVEKR